MRAALGGIIGIGLVSLRSSYRQIVTDRLSQADCHREVVTAAENFLTTEINQSNGSNTCVNLSYLSSYQWIKRHVVFITHD